MLPRQALMPLSISGTLQANINTLFRHKLLGLENTVLAEMKNTRCQYRIGFTKCYAIGEMLQISNSTRRYNRYGY
jgi:hypothetical protein